MRFRHVCLAQLRSDGRRARDIEIAQRDRTHAVGIERPQRLLRVEFRLPVGIDRFGRRGLGDRLLAADLTVDRGRARKHRLVHTASVQRLEKPNRLVAVIFKVFRGVVDGLADFDEGREMHRRDRPVLFTDAAHEVRVADIALLE